MTAKKSDKTDTYSALDLNDDFFSSVPRSTDPDTSVRAPATAHARMAQVGSIRRVRRERHDRLARRTGVRRRQAQSGLEKLRRAIPLLAASAVGALVLVTTIPAGALMSNPSVESTIGSTSYSARGEHYSPVGQKIQAQDAAVTSSRDALSTTVAPGSRQGPSYVLRPNGVIQWPYAAFYGFGDMYGPRDLSDCSYCSPFEEGVDIMAPMGTPIMNTADGIVTKVHNVAAGSGYGTYVQISHNVNGLQFVTQHSHMIEGSIPLVEGQQVKIGTIVGLTGMTGSTSAPHDCFLIFVGGGTTDPIAFMDQHAV